MDLGHHPFIQLDAARAAPRVIDLWKRYEQEQLPGKSPRTAADERAMWRDYVLPKLGEYFIRDVSSDQIEQLHRKVTQAGTPVGQTACIAASGVH